MIDKRGFLAAIQQGNTESFDAFLAQKPLDNDAIGQGILIALDIGKVDYFIKLISLYEGSLADLHNDDGYTFFNLISSAYQKINFEFTNNEAEKQAKKDAFTLAITPCLKALTDDDKDIYRITLKQYLFCSYPKPVTLPEIKALVEELFGKDIQDPIGKVARELGLKVEDIPAGQNPIELYKIKQFIDENQGDKWRRFLAGLYVELNDEEYEHFLSEIQETIQDSSSLQELKTALQYLATAKLREFTQPMNSFFKREFLELLNATDDESLEALERTILFTIAKFNLEFFESKKTIDQYIEDFKTDPKTAYIFELYTFLQRVENQPFSRVEEITLRLYLSQLEKDKEKLKPIAYYLQEAGKYVELEESLNSKLNLSQLGRKGRAIQQAYQELMFDALHQNTPFDTFKSKLYETYQQKMTPPQSTQADTEKTKPNDMQPISLFQRLVNLLKNVFPGEQKLKLDAFFDNLNKNRSLVFKREYTKSMLAAKSIFDNSDAESGLSNTAISCKP